MGKFVKKIRLIDGWRLGENESWLTEMAAKGFHLRRLGVLFAYFEKGGPSDDRYRFDISFASAEDEQIEAFREGGWEFVNRVGAVNVYRLPASLNAPELHSDPAEQAFTLRQLSRRLWLAVALCLPVLIMFAFSHYYAFWALGTPTLKSVGGKSPNAFIGAYYSYLCFGTMCAPQSPSERLCTQCVKAALSIIGRIGALAGVSARRRLQPFCF